tara:strand:- start:1882 stop:2409 length:528 start_codon:yes stop_codon:yes gene_type:complete
VLSTQHANPTGKTLLLDPIKPPLQTGPLLFGAVLTPNQSLKKPAAKVLLGTAGVIFFLGSTIFSLAGAWPISGFFCIEFIVLYLAFRACSKKLQRKEIISLRPHNLTIERITANGTKSSWHFQPYWLRITLRNQNSNQGQLVFSSGGQSVQVGSFLSKNDQISLAAALQEALRRI